MVEDNHENINYKNTSGIMRTLRLLSIVLLWMWWSLGSLRRGLGRRGLSGGGLGGGWGAGRGVLPGDWCGRRLLVLWNAGWRFGCRDTGKRLLQVPTDHGT